MPFIGNIPTAIPLTGADIEDGTIQIADLSATGTKDSTTFLRGDGTFAEAGGGKVLQVVQGSTSTQVTTTSTTATDTGLSASITPSSTSSKILVLVSQGIQHVSSSGEYGSGSIFLVRNSTTIGNTGEYMVWLAVYVSGSPQNIENGFPYSITYLDSPATTSSITYKTQQRLRDGSSFSTQKNSVHSSYITLMEIGA